MLISELQLPPIFKFVIMFHVPYITDHCTLSRGSLYEVVFSDIIIIITIMITIICLFAAVVPPMEGTPDSVHFG